jgi:uncharacterized surface protein with fasciclin (FAS1) repeats
MIKGGMAELTIKDACQRNGVIQVIDHVLVPGWGQSIRSYPIRR